MSQGWPRLPQSVPQPEALRAPSDPPFPSIGVMSASQSPSLARSAPTLLFPFTGIAPKKLLAFLILSQCLLPEDPNGMWESETGKEGSQLVSRSLLWIAPVQSGDFREMTWDLPQTRP